MQTYDPEATCDIVGFTVSAKLEPSPDTTTNDSVVGSHVIRACITADGTNPTYIGKGSFVIILPFVHLGSEGYSQYDEGSDFISITVSADDEVPAIELVEQFDPDDSDYWGLNLLIWTKLYGDEEPFYTLLVAPLELDRSKMN